MSIELRVEEYCQNCTEFEADVEKITRYDLCEKPYRCDTYIYCEHRHKCENLLEHISDKKEKKDEKIC